MQAGLEAQIAQENWEEAAKNAGNLSELWLTLGDVPQAVAYPRQSVEFADRSGDAFLKEVMRTALADALHQAGGTHPDPSQEGMAEAERLFREAEAMQHERQPTYSSLYSLQGFQFCELLLSYGRYQEVLTRAEKALEIVLNGSRNLLDIALNNLSIGRAWLLQAQQQVGRLKRSGADNPEEVGSAPLEPTYNSTEGEGLAHAHQYLNRAVAGLREYGS
jgi:hypothetical protein